MSKETKTTTKPLSLDDMKCGYMIAVDPDGNFDFRIFGKETGAIELLGLHEIAGDKLREPFERNKLLPIVKLLEQLTKTFNEMIEVAESVDGPREPNLLLEDDYLPPLE